MEKVLPRGIRNNNSGNIRQNSIKWQGMREQPFDHEFVEFVSPVFGLRAIMKILLTYHYKYGLDTVQSIINRWAPPHENATDSYATHVARFLGVKRYDIIAVPDMLVKLAQAITIHENGYPHHSHNMPKHWYPKTVYIEALNIIRREI